MANRPEHLAPPEIYYNEEEARRYNMNSRVYDVQVEMTERSVEMLLLQQPEGNLILDIGCGTGISSQLLENNFWVGLDISKFMLYEAQKNCLEGDLILCDIGEPMRFRPQMFDGAISISVLQWLCVASRKSQEPFKRLITFFKWLYSCLHFNARAVLQFYPENAEQLDMILSAAHKCSFNGGLVVDFPNSTKAKKYYLCIWSTMSGIVHKLPEALLDESEDEHVKVCRSYSRKKNKKNASLRSKIIKKKEQQRRKGYETRPDTRYTGRKRPTRF